MPKITEILKNGFTVSAELVPPRNGTSIDKIVEDSKKLKEAGLDFVSITRGAGGSLRGGTLPISYFIQEQAGLDVIAHFTCIDKKCSCIENDLLDHSHFKINNILALRGDLPDSAPGVKSDSSKHSGEYDYAYQLVEQMNNMNQGKYLSRKGFDAEDFRNGSKTNFCIGVAAHPEENDIETAVKHLKAKQDAGAEYAVTQMIFDPAIYKNFVEKAREAGCTIPIIPGIRPITYYDWAVKCEEKFKIPVPDSIKTVLKGADETEVRKNSIELFSKLCQEFKEAGAHGVHLFVVFDTDLALELLNKIKN